MMRLTGLLIAASVLCSASAHASLIDVNFSGDVVSQTGTSFTLDQVITGDFVYNTSSKAFVSFTVGGVAAPTGFTSSATITPGLTDAIYEAQISSVAKGGKVNETFALDLSSLTTWPATTAAALLTDTAQLSTNLDTVNNPLSLFPSTFDYYIGSSSGTGVTTVTADLTTISVSTGGTSVPEPGALVMFVTALLGLSLLRRRA